MILHRVIQILAWLLFPERMVMQKAEKVFASEKQWPVWAVFALLLVVMLIATASMVLLLFNLFRVW